MKFPEALVLVAGILLLERRVTYRRLRAEFGLDQQTLDDVRQELVFRQLAFDENSEGLAMRGEHADVSLGAAAADPANVNDGDMARQLGQSSTSPVSGVSQAAERRQLTVMFCDLVGSTQLSTMMDAEDLRDVITSFQHSCRDAVKAYDGFVARYMGDGMLVYFGYPQAHENDAERASRAGLDIVSAVAALNADVGKVHGVTLAVRVGIATGAVVVGDLIGEGAAEEAAVVGETPNLAARLQGVAQPNQVVVADATRRMLGEFFALEDLGSQTLKGIAEPTQVWRVVAEREVESRFAATRTAKLVRVVGRDDEIGLLLRAWEGARAGRGQVVLVQGEAGLGKSRLLEVMREAARDKAEKFTWLAMRTSPYHIASTLHPVIEHLKRALDWEADDSDAIRIDKLERTLARYQTLPPRSVALFADLMSLSLPEGYDADVNMSAQSQREVTLDALAGWLTEEAERMPVLAVWEDLHWADPTTIELLGMLIAQVPTVPMLIIVTYRPEFTPPWPMRSHILPITLGRLEGADVNAMVSQIASGKTLPGEVLDHIVAKADGVPLYVEELTKVVLESELMSVHEDAYVLTGSLDEMRIPETLQDSLMARLDRFPAMREVAQKAAVLGREFSYEMLSALLGMDAAELQAALSQLVENELLYQRGRPPRSRYIFKHALIQDAAYQSLLRRTRQDFHRQVAEHIEAQLPTLAQTEPEVLAHHWSAAARPAEALAYWERAGQRTRRASAHTETIGHFRNVLKLLALLEDEPEHTQRAIRAQLAIGSALAATIGTATEQVEQAYAAAEALCVKIGDQALLSRALTGSLGMHVLRGEWPQASAVAQRLLELGQNTANPTALVAAYSGLAEICTWQGQFCAALEHATAAIKLIKPIAPSMTSSLLPSSVPHAGLSPFAQVSAYSYGAFAAWMLGYPEQAKRHSEDAIKLAMQLKHPTAQLFALHYAGIIKMFLRLPPDEVLVSSEAQIELGREQQSRQWLAGGHCLRGIARSITNSGEEGIEEAREALSVLGTIGGSTGLPLFSALFADCLARHGRIDEALATLAQARDLGERIGERIYEAEIHRLLGDFKLAQPGEHSHAEAIVHLDRALAIAREQAARMLELRASVSLAQVWCKMGRENDARELLSGIYAWFTEGFDCPDLKEAKALLEQLSLNGPHCE